MIANFKCEICLENFSASSSPRVCTKCGNSICHGCLTGIFVKQGCYTCPYCKHQTGDIWAKNISILNMMDAERGINVCVPHKRKAVSFCSSPDCSLPIEICELAECSKIHKQRGTNNIPISLICETVDSSTLKEIAQKVVENFYKAAEETLLTQLAQSRKEALKRVEGLDMDKYGFKEESQSIVNSLKKCETAKITSGMLSKIKEELLNDEEHKQLNLKDESLRLIAWEKSSFTTTLQNKIKDIQVNFLQVSQQTQQNIVQVASQRVKMEEEEGKSSRKKIIIYEEKEEEPSQFDPIQRIVRGASTPEAQIIQKVLGVSPNFTRLFNSLRDPAKSFKSSIASKPNLFIRVQLIDGKVFGCYFKRPYMAKTDTQIFVIDPDAFVYCLNPMVVFHATRNSTSQYDVSVDYLLSVGNTNNWDGFWFAKDFSKVNPTSNKNVIRSQQYSNMVIPLQVKTVNRFDVFELTF